MTHPSVLFVAQGKKCFIYHNIKWQPTFLELATTLKYLGAKWLPKKMLILCPAITGQTQEKLVLWFDLVLDGGIFHFLNIN